MVEANNQRTVLSHNGPILSMAKRPTTALPAHIKGAIVSRKSKRGESAVAIGKGGVGGAKWVGSGQPANAEQREIN
jgi:hypothetical protein